MRGGPLIKMVQRRAENLRLLGNGRYRKKRRRHERQVNILIDSLEKKKKKNAV